MTPEAERAIRKVVEKLEECRNILDDEMYRKKTVKFNSEDFQTLRAIYDSICKTIDLT